jgi:hypothetical protein
MPILRLWPPGCKGEPAHCALGVPTCEIHRRIAWFYDYIPDEDTSTGWDYITAKFLLMGKVPPEREKTMLTFAPFGQLLDEFLGNPGPSTV